MQALVWNGTRALLVCWLLLHSSWLMATSCAEIWPRAVTRFTSVSLPGGLIYSPNSPTAISNFNRTLGPGDYTIGSHVIDSGTSLVTTGATTRIFVDGNLQINNNAELNAFGPPENLLIVVRGSLAVFNNVVIKGYVLVGGSVFFSNNATITGGLTAVGDIDGWNNAAAYYSSSGLNRLQGGVVCGDSLTCINEDFQTTGLSSNWVVSSSRGSFSPTTVNGRMRLTQNQNNQSTAASFQRLFLGAGNLVTVQFDQYAYGRTTTPGGDGIGIVLSDSSITPQPGAYGGPLGYGTKANENVPGFAGGWLGVGLDEYGNYSTEGGPNGPGRRLQSIAIRGSGSGYTGYRYLAGACNNGTSNIYSNCLSPTIDNNQNSVHRYRLTMDSRTAGQSLVTLERDTGSGFSTIINSFNAAAATGQAAIPTKLILSLTGSTGSANNYHELDNIQICAIHMEPMGEQIDHFEFVHTGNALTCNAAEMTLKACKNASCSELMTSSVTANLSPTASWSGTGVSGNSVTFVGGSTTLKLRQNSPATVNLSVISSTPSLKSLSQALCQVGNSLSAANCALSFADSGFMFDVPTKLANKPATGIQVKAVKTDGTQQCVPAFANVSRDLKFWSTLVSPSTYPGTAPAVTVNDVNIAASSAAATPQSLAFNAQGEATIAVNYADAGQMQLNAAYNGSMLNGDDGLSMTGADLFVSQPAGFCIQTAQSCALGTGDSHYASCPLYRRVGENFPITVTAKAWEVDGDSSFCTGNITTKNFQGSSIGLTATRLAPAVGVDGSLSNSVVAFGSADQGQKVLNSSYSEAGVVQLKTSTLASYLGTSLSASGVQEAAAGRFGPYMFTFDSGQVSPACGSFSYFDQPLAVQATISARDPSGALVQNYRGLFAKASTLLTAEHNNDGVNLSSRVSYTNSTWQAWNAGQLVVNDTLKFTRAASPDGPYAATDFGVLLQPNDPPGSGSGDPLLSSVSLNPNTAGACSNCTAWALGSAQSLRYGRLRVLEAFGSEMAPLPVQLLAEYYNGSQFVTNTLDSCSVVQPSRLTASGTPSVTVSGSNGTLQQGISGPLDLLLSAPEQTGVWPLEYDLTTAPWLQYDWQPGQGALLENPKAQAVFGIYRGQNRQIFWREQ